LGRASVNFGAANQKEPKAMPTLSVEKSQNLDGASAKKGSAKFSAPKRRKATSATVIAKKPRRSVVSRTERAAAKMPEKAGEPRLERVTKQECMLTLLSQPEGASIEEMMQATDWQQHSVRGFLAGTVKKKLGFSLTSSKPDDGVRRYRIKTRRGH
jgi:Protein of unknown function (DUF3489)